MRMGGVLDKERLACALEAQQDLLTSLLGGEDARHRRRIIKRAQGGEVGETRRLTVSIHIQGDGHVTLITRDHPQLRNAVGGRPVRRLQRR